MFELLKELFQLLTPSQRKRFYILQFLVILTALCEVVGVASIAPFMALVGDMSILERDNVISHIYNLSGIDSHLDFVFLVGVGVLITLFISALISMITTWQLSMFATKVGAEVADRLYSYYLKQNWLFHVSGSSAQLTKKIVNEAARVTNQIIQPLMQLNARIILVSFICIAVFSYDPIVAIVGFIAFAFSYLILYKLVRNLLHRNGQLISAVYEQRFRLMSEGFGGIKDVLLLGRDEDFIIRFHKTGAEFSKSQGVNNALAQVPRYFMELIAFGGMIALVLYLVATHNGNLGKILPIMSVYALSGFKLLPAFQLIYNSIARIKGNISAFESIRDDLNNSNQKKHRVVKFNKKNISKLSPATSITLDNIKFMYPGKSKTAINKLNMEIKANSIVGIVGASGSGKSTLIDILLGLITPQTGQLKVDDIVVTKENLRAWQNEIGFVPQSIFLSEGTIAENIAFGISEGEINLDQVEKALKLAHLDELVQSLDKGIYTKVGERGVQLSGGQRQRIGIARALYHEASVLVFDEATSALDGITEKLIMEAIHDFSGQKTIIMIAHRLSTIRECDQIYFMENGEIVSTGTYDNLRDSNVMFNKMTEVN